MMYKEKWSAIVKSKYRYQCQECGSTVLIQAHDPTRRHIDISDGQCLCSKHHADKHPDVNRGFIECQKVFQPYQNVIRNASDGCPICHSNWVVKKNVTIPSQHVQARKLCSHLLSKFSISFSNLLLFSAIKFNKDSREQYSSTGDNLISLPSSLKNKSATPASFLCAIISARCLSYNLAYSSFIKSGLISISRLFALCNSLFIISSPLLLSFITIFPIGDVK